MLTLDNASTHCSEETKLHLKNLKLSVIYLPPYSPTLAPVELLFKILKTKIRSSDQYETTKFSKESGVNLIFNSLSTIKREQLIHFWEELIANAYRWINNS